MTSLTDTRALLTVIDLFRKVERTIPHRDDERHENDVEHSFTLALTAWYLASHRQDLNADRVVRFALIHDLVEAYAGDTWHFRDAAREKEKEEREAMARDQLRQTLTDFPDLHTAIDDYERRDTPEARFVYALDKLLPMLQNEADNGRAWKRDGITLEKVVASKRDKISLDPELATLFKELVAELEAHPEYFATSA